MVEIELKEDERTKCEIWTRVMGYHRPVSEFNRGKKSEFYTRICFTEEKAVAGLNRQKTLDISVAAE